MSVLLNLFRKKEIQYDLDARAEFKCLMEKAQKIRGNSEALHDLIKIVMRPVQDLHIRDAYLKQDHHATGSLDIFSDWFEGNPELSISTFRYWKSHNTQDENLILNLAHDIVLPTCWHPYSLTNILGTIGHKKRKNGTFKQSSNHSVILLQPMKIGFVINGNHSIMQGIIMGDGILMPEEIIDVTETLQSIGFDGVNWINNQGDILGKPRYREFGWVWEIAKLLPAVESSG